MGYSKEEIEKRIDEALIKKAENKSDTALVNLYKEELDQELKSGKCITMNITDKAFNPLIFLWRFTITDIIIL